MNKKRLISLLGLLVLAGTAIAFTILFFRGATIETIPPNQMTKDEATAQKILAAIKDNDSAGLHQLLDKNRKLDLNNRIVFRGTLPLEQCAYYGRLDLFKDLVARGASIDTKPGQAAPDLIFCACKGGCVEMVRYMEQLGMRLDKVNFAGENAAIYAARSGSVAMFEYVLDKGIDTHIKTEFGVDVVMEAASSPSLELFDYLIARGYPVSGRDSMGRNFLYYAGSDSNLCKMINKFPDECAVETKNSENLLFYAAGRNFIESLKLLIRTGKFDVNARDNQGNTALFAAVMSPDDASGIIEILKHEGADLALKNNAGKTAYDVALERQLAYADLLLP